MGQIREAIEAGSRLKRSTDGRNSYIYPSPADYHAIHKGHAAPDMALWIQEALPYLEDYREHIYVEGDTTELPAIDALIARAK